VYTRHWWGNFQVTDNTLVSPSDYSPFYVTVPNDPRLPNAGQQLGPFYDINPDKFGQVNNLLTFADNYGKKTDVYNGVDVSVNVRLPRGILMQGGFNTGREAVDNCSLVGKVDNPGGGITDVNHLSGAGNSAPLLGNITGVASPSPLYCDSFPPYQTQVKLLGSYPLPWGLAASAAFQSVPGPQISATYNVPNALIAPSLGRNLSAGATATFAAQIVAPGAMYNDRLNQVDARLTKMFKLGGTRRVQGQLDFYNLLNTGAPLGQNNTFGAAWLTPTVIPNGRMLKIGAQYDF
jgi:hypothetical protein